jgi:hypothetical protein
LAAMSFSVQRKSMASKPKWASGSVSFSILLFRPHPSSTSRELSAMIIRIRIC